MKTLSLETSTLTSTIALLQGDQVVARQQVDSSVRTARALAPAIKQLLLDHDWQPAEVELCAVTTGPGSFTGLRIGVTTAKTFAYAVGAEVLGVNTLEAIAAAVGDVSAPVWAVIDAGRSQVYAAKFDCAAGDAYIRTVIPTQILDEPKWLQQLRPGETVTGPGLDNVKERLPANVNVESSRLCMPDAVWVGKLATRSYASGQRDDLWSLIPQYFRKGAAEEKYTETRRQ